ncbi:MAG: cysteine--tRNA ligase, partial [Candidatus Aenigmatarchaeota archaeon]
MSNIKLFNTLTRKVEPFKPIRFDEVRMYTCGPTVYDFAHVGNFRAYIVAELLRRWLEYRGYKVTQVMNITDVDDKTIKRSQQQGVPLKEFAGKFEKEFLEDMHSLKIHKPSVICRATDHIAEMVALVKILLEKGYAYKTEDGIYFDIKKFKEYGKLSHFKINELKAGARVAVDEYEKDELSDFALWKFWSEEDGDVFWETEVGKGRPGWHIECSAMSSKNLGETFDIHTGGIDLIFPHHENEIAQSEAATGKKFVNYWVHNEYLLVDGRKMSKRLGNIITVRQLIEEGRDPKAIRYLLLSSQYRTQANFTYHLLDKAKETVDNINNLATKVQFLKDKVPEYFENDVMVKYIQDVHRDFEKHMDDNLDTPQALAVVHEFIGATNKQIDKKQVGRNILVLVQDFLNDFNRVFDVIDVKESVHLNQDEKELIAEREKL